MDEVELYGAGYAAANGVYVRQNTTAHGFPVFKHTAQQLWIRQGANHRYWFLIPRNAAHSKLKIYQVPVVTGYAYRPPRTGWALAVQWGRHRAVSDGWVNEFDSVTTRVPAPRDSG